MRIYALTLLAGAVFRYWKPYDFPDANVAAPLGPQGMFFWLKVMMWQPLLMTAMTGFCGALLQWMKDGWLPLKVITSFLWTAIPVVLMVCFLPRDSGQTAAYLTKNQFQILFLLWLLPTFFFVWEVPSKLWRRSPHFCSS